MTGFDLLLLTLAAYRLWMLAAHDTIAERWRERFLGYSLGDDGKYHRNRWPTPRKRLGEFLHCPWCLGFWISLAAVAGFYAWPHAIRWILLPFAVSAGLALISVCFDRLVLDRK